MKLTTIMLRKEERNWLERLKRKYNLNNMAEVMERIRKVFTKLKLEGELK